MPIPVLVIGIPILVIATVMGVIWGLTSLWDWARRGRIRAFAALEGLSFQAHVTPIALPRTAPKSTQALLGQENFVYGTRQGVEVFACDFYRAYAKQTLTNSMVAVRGNLRDTSMLNLKRWQPVVFQGWTFLIPYGDALPLSSRKIRGMWNLLTLAVKGGDS